MKLLILHKKIASLDPGNEREGLLVRTKWVSNMPPKKMFSSAACRRGEITHNFLISFHGTQNNSRALLLEEELSMPPPPYLMQTRICITPRPELLLLTSSLLASPTTLSFFDNILVSLWEKRKGLTDPGIENK